MIKYLSIVTMVLCGLMLATIVYSQLDQGIQVRPNIQQGMVFLNDYNYDGELLALYMIQKHHPDLGAQALIEARVANTDDFQYPLKQFVSNQSIELDQISPDTMSSQYYPQFISLFRCDPLTPDWINQVSSWTNDGSEFGVYNDSHALMLLSLAKEDYEGGRCGSFPELSQSLDDQISQKMSIIQPTLSAPSDPLDAWIESAAVYAYAGGTLPNDTLSQIVSLQSADGGWKGQLDDVDGSETPHTTAWAILALVEGSS